MTDLRILSGGAANGLVSKLTAQFTAQTGLDIVGDFGAVGGMRDRVRNGEDVDVVILTQAILAQLAGSGHVIPDTVTDLGKVVTGVALRAGVPHPDISTGAALRDLLLSADGLYFPDPKLATAGIHFASVLDRLEIAQEVSGRLHIFPNGQTAMAAMAASTDRHPVGSTQITEILNTPGVGYVGDLPDGYGLTTVYTAGVSATAAQPEAAQALIAILSAPEAAPVRSSVGFTA